MSVEHNISEILANLEGRRPASWGSQAAILAEGIRGSGIIDHVDASSDRLQTNLAGLAAVMGVSTQVIATEISSSNRFLELVVNTLRDPAATAANEKFRTGLTALQKGWRPEAIEELQESIKLYRFHAPTHAALGHALAAEGRLAESADSYVLAQRYSMPDDPGFAAGCVLLAAAALDETGERGRAAEVLKQANASLPDYPELALAYARLSGDTSGLRGVLELEPDLVIAALASEISDVDAVAADIVQADGGPVALANDIRGALARIRAEFPETVIDPELPTLPAPTPIDELLAAAVILRSADRISTSLTAQWGAAGSARAAVLAQREKDWQPSVGPLRTELAVLQARSAEQTARESALRRDLDDVNARLAVPRESFIYRSNHVGYLESPGHRPSWLLDEIHDLEAATQAGTIPAGWPSIQSAQGAVSRKRRELAGLGIKDAEARRENDIKTYYAAVRSAKQTLTHHLEALPELKESLRAEMEPVQRELDQRTASFEKERASEAEAHAARALRWDELVLQLRGLAAQRPVRRHPWDGGLAQVRK